MDIWLIIENGAVSNRIVWDGDTDTYQPPAEATWMPDRPGVGIGWIYDREADAFAAPAAPAEPVPETITMRQAKIQLSRARLLAQADAAIAAMGGQPGEEARLEWEYATTLRRDHPLVVGIGQALGLDDAEKDDLFRKAAKIQ